MDWFSFTENALFNKIASSLIFLLGIIVFRILTTRAIARRESLTMETKRRWIVTTRNALLALLLGGLIMIWARQLQMVATSLVVIAAAIAIAMKELFLCIGGAFLRATTQCFAIGDRIVINDLRGDVIDQSLFGTTILEVGPGPKGNQLTGRSIFIPNSILLTPAVINETRLEKFVLHLIIVPINMSSDWHKAEKALLRAGKEVCEPFLDEARKHMEAMALKHGLEAPYLAPQVYLQIPDMGRIELRLRAPVPARQRGRLEQDILRRFLEYLESSDPPIELTSS